METENRRSHTIPYLRIASFLVLAIAVVIGGVLAGIRLTYAASSTPELYEVRQGGSIWAYTGSGWQQLGSANSFQTDNLVGGSNALYQLHTDGSIWSYNGTSWTALPHNPSSSQVNNFKVSKSGDVFEALADGSVWAYQFGAWQQIDNSGPYVLTTDAGDWGFHSAG
ncbi:hypothetical protein KSF_090630 [Reticulibacter mediterranei]|uniref:Tachylectin 2 domain-containing protein n=1 Tax=Reticulibacter mediterranei TaxID=2778369 RepID=A0A8J3IYC2_9CHLR|nr:hypothetical protein [Reticulibacter mediterranei]GHO99015.1 hypothetical protein KSF_090630 [Reticulibacter mediterranei]